MSLKILKMPVRFCEKEQALILKLINYFQREKDAGKPLLPFSAVYNRVSDALDVSLSTVQKLATKGIERDGDTQAKTKLAISLSRGQPLYKIHEHTIRTRIYAMYVAGEHVAYEPKDD